MTVGEMIEELKAFDPSLKLVVAGYEYGLSDPCKPTEEKIVLDVIHDIWAGPHDRFDDNCDEKEKNVVSAVIIGRIGGSDNPDDCKFESPILPPPPAFILEGRLPTEEEKT